MHEAANRRTLHQVHPATTSDPRSDAELPGAPPPLPTDLDECVVRTLFRGAMIVIGVLGLFAIMARDLELMNRPPYLRTSTQELIAKAVDRIPFVAIVPEECKTLVLTGSGDTTYRDCKVDRNGRTEFHRRGM